MSNWTGPPSTMDAKKLLLWIVFVALLAISPLLDLIEAGTVSWIALGIGFLAFSVLASEYASQTQLGHRIDDWWKRIGIPGRFFVIVAFAVVLWSSYLLLEFPRVPIESFVLGGFLGLAIKFLIPLVKRTATSDHPTG